MSTNLYLTDEDSVIPGYKRLKLGARSDNPSLVRSVTTTAAGPSAGIQITRTAGGTALAWISDPLAGKTLTAATWAAHIWAKESDAAANAALRFQILPWTVAEQAAALDDNGGTELTATTADYNRTTGAATQTVLTTGTRLVFKILVDDAGTLGASQTVTVAYNGQLPRAEGDSYLTCPDDLVVSEYLPLTTSDRVRRLVSQERQAQGEAAPELIDDMIGQAFAEALRGYSGDRPLVVVAAMSGDGTTYDFPLPSRWVRGFSQIIEIEYPAGEQVPTTVDPADWFIRESVLGVQPTRLLRFRATVPASGTDNMLVRYTSRHVHTTETDTVPADDLDAVCCLAGAIVAEMLGAARADSADATINADTVNHRDGEQRWAAVARHLRARYDAHLGLGGKVAAASLSTDWDTAFSGGEDRLFRRRAIR